MRTKASCRASGTFPAARRTRVLPTLALLAAALLLALGGCGRRYYDEGLVVVDNRTDLTTNEFLLTFRLAPFGRPFTSDLLGGDLAPASARSMGVWHEDYYDAEGDLELGQLVEWFDLFVGNHDTTVFEVR